MHWIIRPFVCLVLAAGVFIAPHYDSLAAEPASTTAQPTNRLAKESSLYLTMHGHNPVDWYPWGEEALKKAKAENKPIFLSIGYASCHWCHVMERESFMDAEIAKLLNEHFVAIKVDREERPDIDFLYMTALHALNGRGGWPLTMFLTPDAKPVIGGTYFPPRAKDDQAGFFEFASAVQQKWAEDPEAVAKQGARVTEHLQELMRQRPVILGSLDEATLAQLTVALAEDYDPEHGGFGFSPEQPKKSKFPQPSHLMFLLDRAVRNPEDRKAKNMLLNSLAKMAQGGICDQVGGGFHRYSTDRFWRVPHFEKMLYDNGQLATLYAEAFALTGRSDFRRVTVQLLDFVLRDLTDKEGAFYASQDADSDGAEGRAYVWSSKELEATLSQDELAIFLGAYGLGEQIDDDGRHVIVMHKPLAETATERGLTELALEEQLKPLRQKLLARRQERPKPATDAKILTAWNGLMIRGLADGGRILKEPRYVQAAARAADFIITKLVTPESRLMRSYAAGQARLPAYLDDYSFLVDGLIALHRATGDQKWLDAADRLTAKQLELFWDDRAGGFFFTASDHEELIARSKDPTDGDTPAGNSVAAGNLLYLADKLNKPEYTKRAEATLRGVIPLFDRSPASVPRMTAVLAEYLSSSGKSK